MLKRLQHKRSQYNIHQMEKERKKIEKNISLISQFPFKKYPQSHTAVNVFNQLHSSGLLLTVSPKRINFPVNLIFPLEEINKYKAQCTQLLPISAKGIHLLIQKLFPVNVERVRSSIKVPYRVALTESTRFTTYQLQRQYIEDD